MFCPKCNSPSFARVKANEFCCLQCDFTYFHNVASAVAAIIRYKDTILLTKRAIEPAMGKLDLPGGFVDPNESLEQALIREVKEELNLDLHTFSYLFSAPNQYTYKNVTYDTCDSFFEVVLDIAPNIDCDNREIENIYWVKFESLNMSELAFDSAKSALQRYLTN